MRTSIFFALRARRRELYPPSRTDRQSGRPPLFEMNKLIKSQADVIASDYGVDSHGEDSNQDLKQTVLIQIPLINQYYLLIRTVEVLSACYTTVLASTS